MPRLPLCETDIIQLSDAIKAMAHPLRYKMVCLLGNGEMSMQNLVTAIGTSHSNASQHLAMLHASGVVHARRAASRVYYRIRDHRTIRLLAMSNSLFACPA
ncbi:ArsR/SmtB family transcription factor [Acidithiobacillus sp.]|uniref:ArsR/SmtB family transcription factor n=1 Tax=Acidithiobacillus sp. TaxID=1872118 RepID=UPI003CFFD83E